LIPGKPGDRVTTTRRDAISLAGLLRSADLAAVWVPDEGREAMRDPVRARAAAVETLRVLTTTAQITPPTTLGYLLLD